MAGNVRFGRGPRGFTGATGATGATGPTGPTGPAGTISVLKVTVTHTQLQAAATTNNITLVSLPAGGIVVGHRLKPQIIFDGTGITDYFLMMGIAGDLAAIMPEYDVESIVAGDTTYAEGQNFQSFNFNAAVDLKIGARSVGGNLNASTQGSADIEIFYIPKT